MKDQTHQIFKQTDTNTNISRNYLNHKEKDQSNTQLKKFKKSAMDFTKANLSKLTPK